MLRSPSIRMRPPGHEDVRRQTACHQAGKVILAQGELQVCAFSTSMGYGYSVLGFGNVPA